MRGKTIFYIFFIYCSCVCNSQCPEGTSYILINETFESNIPLDWSMGQGSDGEKWHINSNPIGYYANPGEGNWLSINDEINDQVGKAVLKTPIFDLSRWEKAVVIDMDISFQQFAGLGKLSLDVWSGDQWKQILHFQSDFNGHITLEIDTFKVADFQLRFSYDDESVWNWGWGLDNFMIRKSNENCGNGICDPGEMPANCPLDCPKNPHPNSFWIDIGKDLEGQLVKYAYFKGDTKCDDCSEKIDLGFSFNFFGTDYQQAYLNSNGNLTFQSSFVEYTPSPFCLDGPTMIAPFFSDVDLRRGGEIRYYLDPQHQYAIFTWSNVGYYGCEDHCRMSNSFQCILTDGSVSRILGQSVDISANAAFIYQDMQWTTGSSSGGKKGFGGSAGTVGLNLGYGDICMDYGRFGHVGFDYYGNSQDDLCADNGVSHLDDAFLWVNGAKGHIIFPEEVGTQSLEGYSSEERSSKNNSMTALSSETDYDSLATFLLLKTYPNPYSDVLHIVYQSPSEAFVFYYLVDISGREVYTNSFKASFGEYQHQLVLPELPKGSYLIHFIHPQGKTFAKVVRQ